MKNLLKIILPLLFITGCNNRNNSVENIEENTPAPSGTPERLDSLASAKHSQLTDTSIVLDYFPAIPDTIDGCGEYFSNQADEVKNDRYVFISNLSEFAMIRIKGKNIFLQKNIKESKEIDEKTYVAVYEGEGYKAILKVRQTKGYDEGGFYTGNLEIMEKGKSSVIAVHGETGC